MLGTTISHYQILQRLGEGGMGVVYKALDTTLGRTVALKFISAAAGADDVMKERLAREAKACAALNHPNITTVYEFVQTEEHEFIAIEFVEGQTLEKVLESKQYDHAEVIPLAFQLLDGLEAAHRKGVIHRDLKASNIMLDADGRLKIMDFGLAKFAQGSMLTQSGSTVGTAAYMSPEQARGENIDHRSDIYSLGVVLYQLLTGKLPFPHAHHLAVLYAVVNEDPKPLRAAKPDIPAPLEGLVLKAMAKNPDERYQSCAEMAASLLQISEGIGGMRSLRGRYRHLIEGATAASGGSGPLSRAPWLSWPGILKYVVPSLLAVLAIVYAAVTMIPTEPGGVQQGGEQGISDARRVAMVHVDSALAFMNLKDATLAFRELQLAIEADSTCGLAWANLAVLNIRARRLDLAMMQGRKALPLLGKREGSAVCYNLAYTLEEMGNTDEAIAWYSEAIMTDSSFAAAYCALANLHVKNNRAEEALRLLVRFERLYPETPDRWLVYRSYGKAHLALLNYKRAREVLEQSYQLRPDDPQTLSLLASTYETLRMEKESLSLWEHYSKIEKDPAKVAEALRHIAKLRKKAG